MSKKGKLAINGGPKAVPDSLILKPWPDIREEDKAAVMAALDRGIVHGAHSPEMTGLEADWGDFVGSQYVLAFNSGTAALHGGTFAMRIGPGDEVITSAFSFSGSYQPILHQNGIPVFVDIDPRTYNLDVAQIESKITDRTKAIVPVHLHGLPADLDEIVALAEKHDLFVLEDAAQAQGALYKGKMAGTIGDMGAFSLNATKNLCGGEGGLFVTDNEELYTLAKTMRQYGEPATDAPEYIRSYACSTIGYNYRTQEMPAAFARSQLRRLDEYTRIAQRNAEYLNKELGKIAGLIPPHVPADRTHVYYKYRLRFDPETLGLQIPTVQFRNSLLNALQAEGVQATLWHTDPLPAFSVFQTLSGYGKGCPWSCPFYGKEIHYRKEDYPEAVRALDTSLIVNTEPYHIAVQDLEVQAAYVEAFRKIFDNLDELLDPRWN